MSDQAGDPTPSPSAAIAEVVARLAEMSRPLIESAAGYRAQAEQEGFSETAAEAMAVAFHECLMRFLGAHLLMGVKAQTPGG